MLFKCTLIIIQVTFFIYLRNNILHASEIDRLICKGVLWENSKAHYTEWQVIKLKSKYQIYFQTNNFKKRAKVSSLKHNKEKVIERNIGIIIEKKKFYYLFHIHLRIELLK